MRAAIYLRQSEDRTGEEWGIERQREDVMRVVTARGWDVVGEYVDNDVSATKRKPRPKFNEMMRHVEAGGVDVICSKHMDRLLRRLLELEETLQRCEGTGTYIVTTSDGVDTSTEGGRLVARILASVAQGEIDRKKARQVSAAQQAAKQGRWTGGRRPFGYESDGVTIRGSEATLIRAAYGAVIAGRSLYSIAADWNRAGIKTTAGNDWTGPTVRQMLERHRYTGTRTYRGIEQDAPALWAPIVDQTVWDDAMTVLTAPGRRAGDNTRKYLLSGILICGKCGRTMGSSFNLHLVYKCKHCGGVSRQMEPIDQLVTKLVLGFMATDEAQELIHTRSSANVGELRKKEKTLLDKIDKIAIERVEELLTGRQAKIATEALEARLVDVRKELKIHVRSRELDELACAEPEPVWKSFSLDRRRTVIREVVELKLLPVRRGVRFKPEHLRYRWLLAEE